MNENLIKAQDIILNKVNQICSKYGLNNIMAQLYTILYLSNRPLSLSDMCERLNISKGSVSVNIRALERYGVVRRFWVKGSRKDYYEAEKNISKVIIDRAKSMVNSRLSEVGDMIDLASQTLNSIDDARDEEELTVFKERLEELKNIYERARALSDLMNSSLSNGLLTVKEGESEK